jgi:GT2 family glycosyltransferase
VRETRAAIVIPAYNAATTIGETLESVQANPELSRITLVALLDDLSTDGTGEVARAHWRSQVPLEIWRNPENMGLWQTTNALFARVADRVDWTFILHNDDVVKPNWLSLYLDELPRLPASVATICSSYDDWWSASGRIVTGEEWPDRPPVHVTGDRASVRDTLNRGTWWHVSGCAIRNAAFLDIGAFRPDMPQLGDCEWLLRCLAKGYGVWYLPRTTMLYRLHEGSISSHSFRIARDIKERLQVFAMMRSQGYISDDEHNRKMRDLIRQLARRTLVRAARRDWHSFHHHATLLREIALRLFADKILNSRST